jgi:hypothetical protein
MPEPHVANAVAMNTWMEIVIRMARRQQVAAHDESMGVTPLS